MTDPTTPATVASRPRIGYEEPALSRRTRIVTATLLLAVLASSFLGHFQFPVLGFRVRIEQVTPLLLVAWMLFHPMLRGPFLRATRHPVVIAFALFVAWNLVSTLVFSPDYGWSASILGWLVIDLLLLVALISLRFGARLLARVGPVTAVPWGLAGLIVFIVANVTRGAVTFGTDFDWLYEVYVARVTAIEANIFASILIFWGLLAITRRRLPWWFTALLSVAVPAGLFASQTRTAVFSMLAGLAVFMGYTLLRRTLPPKDRLARVIPSLVMCAALLVSYLAAATMETGTSPAPGASSSQSASATPSASSTPDPLDPDTQNKIGDLDLTGGTIAFRLEVAQLAAEDMTGVNLWFGNGTNTFGLRHEQPGTPGVSGHIIMLPVQVVYDSGIVGLALLVAALVTVFVRTPRERKPVAAGFLVSFAISATLTSMFWFAIVWIVFAILLRPVDPPASAAPAQGARAGG